MFNLIICDDEIYAREKIKSSIKWKDFDFNVVGMFSNGADALEMIRKSKVDIVLSDIKMPVLDGIELVKILHEEFPHIKVILFSAFRDFSHAKAAVHYHVFDYILKPINYSELYDSFKNLHDILAAKMNHAHFPPQDILTQRNEYFSEAIVSKKNLEQLSLSLKNTDANVNLTDCRCAHIRILPDNLDTLLNKDWKYGTLALNNIFSNIISPETNYAYYPILAIRNNVIEIFAIQKQDISDAAFEQDIHSFCKESTDKLYSVALIKAEFKICQLCSNITELKIEDTFLSANLQNDDGSDMFAQIIELINNNYMDDISLDYLASKLYVNPFFISRLFKKNLNDNYINYLTKVRIEKAKQLLACTDLKISLIGEKVGYKIGPYFYKVFKKNVGVSPAQYRLNNSNVQNTQK